MSRFRSRVSRTRSLLSYVGFTSLFQQNVNVKTKEANEEQKFSLPCAIEDYLWTSNTRFFRRKKKVTQVQTIFTKCNGEYNKPNTSQRFLFFYINVNLNSWKVIFAWNLVCKAALVVTERKRERERSICCSFKFANTVNTNLICSWITCANKQKIYFFIFKYNENIKIHNIYCSVSSSHAVRQHSLF